MCGIAGFIGVALEGNRERAEGVLRSMAAAMHMRGPDEKKAVWDAASGSGLVATRLAMVDTQNGSQPAANEDQTIWSVLNGEIYNHGDLRKQLVQRDHSLRSGSDTEVLPHLYEDQGHHLVKELRGMFSIAVLDLKKHRLLLARDHAGMKPLFYAFAEEGLVFASDVRALFASGLIEAEVAWDSIGKYFHLGYIPAPDSAFTGIYQLAPGSFLLWEKGKTVLERHWSAPVAQSEFEGSPPERLEQLLKSAVITHLQGDVAVGCYLSGGWDSSLLAALAQRQKGGLKTFSLIMPDHPRQDESRHSREVAAILGTEHHEIEFHASMLPQLLEESAWHLEEPFHAAPQALMFLLSKAASSHVKAVIGGEGADELLGGYPWLQSSSRSLYLWRRFFPRFLARIFASQIHRRPLGREFYRRVASRSRDELDFELTRRLSPCDFPDLAKESHHLDHRTLGYPSLTGSMGDGIASTSSHLQRRLFLEYGGRLTGALLPMGDRMSMAHGLEVRMPFLDRDVVEFCMSLPDRWKIRGRQEKAILRPLVEKHIPVVAGRQKYGLRVPAAARSGDYLAFAKDVLFSSESLFSREEVERALNPQVAPTDLLQSLLYLQLWWNAYFGPGASLRLKPFSGSNDCSFTALAPLPLTV